MNYLYRTDEFPNRRFPSSPQIGWLADDVRTVVPEVVVTDSEGYGAISYAHAAVLVAEAVKELKQQHDQEIENLKNEISELKSVLKTLLHAQ